MTLFVWGALTLVAALGLGTWFLGRRLTWYGLPSSSDDEFVAAVLAEGILLSAEQIRRYRRSIASILGVPIQNVVASAAIETYEAASGHGLFLQPQDLMGDVRDSLERLGRPHDEMPKRVLDVLRVLAEDDVQRGRSV
jgi:hypothetical protein